LKAIFRGNQVARLSKWVILLGLGLVLNGCGYKELPGMKEQTQSALKNVMLQYRLRADIVPGIIKLLDQRSQYQKLLAEIKTAHGNAIGIDIPIQQLDERQMNRLASFQSQLSSQIARAIQILDADKQIAANPEYQSIKNQLAAADGRVAAARQQYLSEAPKFNARLSKKPEKWFNAFLYKFEPFPQLQ
jgi:LemA protein